MKSRTHIEYRPVQRTSVSRLQDICPRTTLQRREAAVTSRAVRLVCFGDIHMAFRAIERLGPTLARRRLGDSRRRPDALRRPARRLPRRRRGAGALPQRPRRHRQPRHALGDRRVPRRTASRCTARAGASATSASSAAAARTSRRWTRRPSSRRTSSHAVLERGHATVADAPRRLMVCHTPPYDTRLDRLMNGTPVGSPAVRAFIETRPARRRRRRSHPRGARRRPRSATRSSLNAGALRDGGYVVVDDDGDAAHAPSSGASATPGS